MSRRRGYWIPGSGPTPPKPELEILKEGNAKHFKPPAAQPTSPHSTGPRFVPYRSRSRVSLVPSEAEIAALPRLAREALLARCALRVTRAVATVADAACVLLQTATIDTPLTSQLRCIRRDFVRLKKLAREEKWTDDTPVPPEVFGPLWPEGVAPYWAVEPPPAGA